MYLYYQDLLPDCNAEFIAEYETVDEMMKKIKQQCDDGHDECPEYVPTFNEYLSNDFSKYSDNYEYSLYIPTDDEVNKLKEDDYINIIKDCVDDEYAYFVTKYKLFEDDKNSDF